MRFTLIEKQIDYNANPHNKNEGDCTIRALSLAYDLPYNNVKGELNSLASKEHAQFNRNDIVEKFIENHGYSEVISNEGNHGGNLSTVGNFANTHKHGTFVVHCSNSTKQNTSSSFHLVTIMDGNIYDTWDSSKYYVINAWEVKRNTHRNYKFNIEDYFEFIVNAAVGYLNNNGVYFDNYNVRKNNDLNAVLTIRINNKNKNVYVKLNNKDIEKSQEEIQSIIEQQVQNQLRGVE